MKRGFTLLEVMLALAILAFAAIVVLQFDISAVRKKQIR